MSEASQILDYLRERRAEMVELTCRMASIESPSDSPALTRAALLSYEQSLRDLNFRTILTPGRNGGGHLYGRPRERQANHPSQLVIGQIDTVWPVGTLENMPIETDGERLRGPGVYDMKSGLVQILFALRALQDLDLPTGATPLIFVNTDEEIGSRESTRWIRRLSQTASRAFILEPSLGTSGRLKTSRKGIGRFTIRAHGRAAHAGIEPEAGASAIAEIAQQIGRLFAMNDPERGISVNVGKIEGGLAPNVVAHFSEAIVDVRVRTHEDAERVTAQIHALEPLIPGVVLEVEGGIGRPPMEVTKASNALWEHAVRAAEALGIPLEQAMSGGASDGNTTSQYIPTLDGLGAVGDGAHARHEYVLVDSMAERAALLALLLRLTPEEIER